MGVSKEQDLCLWLDPDNCSCCQGVLERVAEDEHKAINEFRTAKLRYDRDPRVQNIIERALEKAREKLKEEEAMRTLTNIGLGRNLTGALHKVDTAMGEVSSAVETCKNFAAAVPLEMRGMLDEEEEGMAAQQTQQQQSQPRPKMSPEKLIELGNKMVSLRKQVDLVKLEWVGLGCSVDAFWDALGF
jgi:hypothetical protein